MYFFHVVCGDTTTTITTTPLPITTIAPVRMCTQSRDFASTAAGGFRYTNGQTAADRVFQHQDNQASIAFADFKAICFGMCANNLGCAGVYFLTGTTLFTCNGLSTLGVRASSTAVTESWRLSMLGFSATFLV
jgi:hypothetical protein